MTVRRPWPVVRFSRFSCFGRGRSKYPRGPQLGPQIGSGTPPPRGSGRPLGGVREGPVGLRAASWKMTCKKTCVRSFAPPPFWPDFGPLGGGLGVHFALFSVSCSGLLVEVVWEGVLDAMGAPTWAPNRLPKGSGEAPETSPEAKRRKCCFLSTVPRFSLSFSSNLGPKTDPKGVRNRLEKRSKVRENKEPQNNLEKDQLGPPNRAPKRAKRAPKRRQN